MDRRSRKTRNHITQAIVSLMREETWENVTIQQICDRADIARSTYYLHFAGKAELFDYCFRHLGEHMRTAPRTRSLDGDGKFGVLPTLLGMMTAPDHEFLFRAPEGASTTYLSRDHLRKVLMGLLTEEAESSERFGGIPQLSIEFIAAGILAAIGAWYQGRVERDLDEWTKALDDLVAAVGHVVHFPAVVGLGEQLRPGPGAKIPCRRADRPIAARAGHTQPVARAGRLTTGDRQQTGGSGRCRHVTRGEAVQHGRVWKRLSESELRQALPRKPGGNKQKHGPVRSGNCALMPRKWECYTPLTFTARAHRRATPPDVAGAFAYPRRERHGR